jgi:hypothetical protein
VELDKRLEPILDMTVGEFSNLEIISSSPSKLSPILFLVDGI